MTLADRISTWVRANRWFVALVFVVIAGYSVGKDRALRDNAIDARAAAGGIR